MRLQGKESRERGESEKETYQGGREKPMRETAESESLRLSPPLCTRPPGSVTPATKEWTKHKDRTKGPTALRIKLRIYIAFKKIDRQEVKKNGEREREKSHEELGTEHSKKRGGNKERKKREKVEEGCSCLIAGCWRVNSSWARIRKSFLIFRPLVPS